MHNTRIHLVQWSLPIWSFPHHHQGSRNKIFFSRDNRLLWNRPDGGRVLYQQQSLWDHFSDCSGIIARNALVDNTYGPQLTASESDQSPRGSKTTWSTIPPARWIRRLWFNSMANVPLRFLPNRQLAANQSGFRSLTAELVDSVTRWLKQVSAPSAAVADASDSSPMPPGSLGDDSGGSNAGGCFIESTKHPIYDDYRSPIFRRWLEPPN